MAGSETYNFSGNPLQSTIETFQQLADTSWSAEKDVAESQQKKATYLLTFAGAILAAVSFKIIDAFEHGTTLVPDDPWKAVLIVPAAMQTPRIAPIFRTPMSAVACA